MGRPSGGTEIESVLMSEKGEADRYAVASPVLRGGMAPRLDVLDGGSDFVHVPEGGTPPFVGFGDDALSHALQEFRFLASKHPHGGFQSDETLIRQNNCLDCIIICRHFRSPLPSCVVTIAILDENQNLQQLYEVYRG